MKFIKKSTVLGLGLLVGGTTFLGACDNGGQSDIATIKGDAYTEKEVINDLRTEGMLSTQELSTLITKQAIMTYYKPTKEEYEAKIKEYKEQFKKNNQEFTDAMEKDNKSRIELGIASEKAYKDLAPLSDKEINAHYSKNKTAYDVIDVAIVDTKKAKVSEVKKDMKAIKDDKSLEKFKKKYGVNINAVAMTYKQGQLPGGFDKDKLKKGVVLESDTKTQGMTNLMKVKDVKELKLTPEYKKEIETNLRMTKIPGLDSLLVKLQEKHKDFKISDDMKKAMEDEKNNPAQPGANQPGTGATTPQTSQ